MILCAAVFHYLRDKRKHSPDPESKVENVVAVKKKKNERNIEKKK